MGRGCGVGGTGDLHRSLRSRRFPSEGWTKYNARPRSHMGQWRERPSLWVIVLQSSCWRERCHFSRDGSPHGARPLSLSFRYPPPPPRFVPAPSRCVAARRRLRMGQRGGRSNDGAFTQRSMVLSMSTEIPAASVSCSWVRCFCRRSCRRHRIGHVTRSCETLGEGPCLAYRSETTGNTERDDELSR